MWEQALKTCLPRGSPLYPRQPPKSVTASYLQMTGGLYSHSGSDFTCFSDARMMGSALCHGHQGLVPQLPRPPGGLDPCPWAGRAAGLEPGLGNSRQHFPPLSEGNALLLLSRFHGPIWFSGQPPSPPPSPHHPTTSTPWPARIIGGRWRERPSNGGHLPREGPPGPSHRGFYCGMGCTDPTCEQGCFPMDLGSPLL